MNDKFAKTITPEFRVSFPNVFKPRAFAEGLPAKYSVVMLINKKEDISDMRALAKKAAEAKWPDPAKRPKLRNPFRDGDTEKPDMDGYPGHYFINASGKHKPGLVDRDKQPILMEEDFYAGCYARASVTAYAYSTAGNNGVSFGLQNIQKLRDGESFSGKMKAEDEFDAVEGPEIEGGGATVAQEDNMFM